MKKISLHKDFFPLLRLAIPLLLAGISHASNFFVVTIFISHLGQKALAAGALAFWLYITLVVISLGIMSAINVLVAHKHGENNKTAISDVLRDGILLTFIIAVPTIILLWNIAPIFLLFGQKHSIVVLSTAYLHAIAYGVVPQLIMSAFIEFLVGIAHTRVILIITIISSALNIISSYVLIFGKFNFTALGIAGAGWGITISNYITMIVLISYMLLTKRYRIYYKNMFNFFGTTYLWSLIKIGAPIGLMYCIEVGFFFAVVLIMGTFGSVWLAANQVAMQYMGSLMEMIFFIAQAITVRMGHLLGQKKIRSSMYAAYSGIAFSALLMVFVAIAYIGFPDLLISIDFDVSNPANQLLIKTIRQLLIVAALFQFFESIRISLFGALRALKDTTFTLLISILSFWGIALPLGYVLAKFLGLGGVGLWWGMIASVLLSVMLLSWRFYIKIKSY